MAIGPGLPGFLFNRMSIIQKAPNASGCYALYSQGWVYIGESNDIQRRLPEHLAEVGTRIRRAGPTGFTFELCAAHLRVDRQNTPIAQLQPSCNQMFG